MLGGRCHCYESWTKRDKRNEQLTKCSLCHTFRGGHFIKHLKGACTHPYERKHVHPTPMSTTEQLSLEVDEVTTSASL